MGGIKYVRFKFEYALTQFAFKRFVEKVFFILAENISTVQYPTDKINNSLLILYQYNIIITYQYIIIHL